MTLVDAIYAMTLLVLFSLFFFILKGLKITFSGVPFGRDRTSTGG